MGVLFFKFKPKSSFLSNASLTMDVIQAGFTGGIRILLFVSNIVSGLSVFNRTVKDNTSGKYCNSSCIEPESVISAQQCPLSRNSMTCAYSLHNGVMINLSGKSRERLYNFSCRLYDFKAEAVAFSITRTTVCSVFSIRLISPLMIEVNL